MEFRNATAGFALVLGLAVLAGCPGASTTPGNSGNDINTAGGINPGIVTGSTTKPTATSTPAATPTPVPTATVPGSTPAPSPTPTVSGGRYGVLAVKVLNPISQMWLPQSLGDLAPNSIPSTYSFRAEVVVGMGLTVATSSSVTWTSSRPDLLVIDGNGNASCKILPDVSTSTEVIIAAATGGISADPPVTLLVGNSGIIEIGVE